eukprot:TRINITY_DN16_c0_g2_i1.p2 TRINITY_DN16_c0_g2~~TRINITY_DN16_c0_g2_i1.p2  ORF type:complete len:324 (-),score=54.89 TRINITY_DN16_c0_g2_i1:1461-2432(-)
MGDVLAKPITDKEPFFAKNESLAVGGSAMQGWRRGMEDAHSHKLNLDPSEPGQWAYFGVFDGHCGKQTAIYAGEHLHRVITETPQWQAKPRDVPMALRNGYLEMDAKFKASPQRDTSGCTAVVCVIGPNAEGKRTLWCANAGDSRAVLSRGGRAVPMSIDHKPTLDSERHRILAAGGFVAMGRVNGNLALSRALGDFDFKAVSALPPEQQAVSPEPEVQSLELTPEDEFVVLACDGIWDVMTNEQVVAEVRRRIEEGAPLDAICHGIFDQCLAPNAPGLGCDNMTMMIVLLHPRSAEVEVGQCDQAGVLMGSGGSGGWSPKTT